MRIEAFLLSNDYRAEIDSTRVLYASKDKLLISKMLYILAKSRK